MNKKPLVSISKIFLILISILFLGLFSITSISTGSSDDCEPRTIGYWKQPCKGHYQHETIESMLSYLDMVNSSSNIFSAISNFGELCYILDPPKPASMEQRAKQQLMALWFNVISEKLFLSTQINLGSLSNATTIEEVLEEIENLISSGEDVERTKDMADYLNNGNGIVLCEVPEGFCGDDFVDISAGEECELPDTSDNTFCQQTTQQCLEYKLGLRDTYGDCDSNCLCVEDTFVYSCVKGECGAECEVDTDCLCPEDDCIENDYYDYPDYGYCTDSCLCDVDIDIGSPCEPVIYLQDPRCGVPPSPNKTVGEPKKKWYPTEDEETFYPDISTKCWNESSEEYIECWKVTTMTPITMDCIASGPPLPDNMTIYYRILLDGELAQNWTEVDSPHTFYFEEESQHELEFYCVDVLGNEGPIDIEKFKVEGITFNIILRKKWNLISVPFVLFNNSISKVFEDIAEDIESVWKYDNGNWYVWTPSNSNSDTFNTIDTGWGYFVLAKNDTTLVIGGSLFNLLTLPPSRDLVAGWNLIGYYGTNWLGDLDNYDSCEDYHEYGNYAYCALNSLVDTQEGFPRWSSLIGYNNCGNDNTYWLDLDVCDIMYAGKGYWIEMGIDDTYTPTTCVWNENFKCV